MVSSPPGARGIGSNRQRAGRWDSRSATVIKRQGPPTGLTAIASLNGGSARRTRLGDASPAGPGSTAVAARDASARRLPGGHAPLVLPSHCPPATVRTGTLIFRETPRRGIGRREENEVKIGDRSLQAPRLLRVPSWDRENFSGEARQPVALQAPTPEYASSPAVPRQLDRRRCRPTMLVPTNPDGRGAPPGLEPGVDQPGSIAR